MDIVANYYANYILVRNRTSVLRVVVKILSYNYTGNCFQKTVFEYI